MRSVLLIFFFCCSYSFFVLSPMLPLSLHFPFLIATSDRNLCITSRASSNYSDFLKRHFHLRNRLLDQGYKKIRLIRSLKKFIFRYQDLVEIYSVSAEKIISDGFSYKWKCIKISGQKQKCQNIFINVWRKNVFDIHFTEFGAVMTTVLPVLFKYCYKYCYSDSRRLWAVMKEGGLVL